MIESGKVENVKMWTVVVVAVPRKGSEGSPNLNVVSILKRMLLARHKYYTQRSNHKHKYKQIYEATQHLVNLLMTVRSIRLTICDAKGSSFH